MSNQTIKQSTRISPLIDTYNINKFFENYVLQKEYYPYQFDGWSEKKFYGLVNNKNEAIYPKNSFLGTVSNSNGITFKNLRFINDAFEAMMDYHLSFLRGNRFSKNQSIYINLNIRAAYKDINEIYLSYMSDLFAIFNNTYLTTQRKNTIKDFNSFSIQFINFTKLISKYSPINRSSYIENSICDLAVSGLTFSFADEVNFSNARIKADKYISDPNFDIFLDSAKRFGFYVDRNAPWRIVADLNSPALKQYYSLYNLNSVDDIFTKCYHVAYLADLDVLKNVLIGFWNSYCNTNNLTVTQREQFNCKNLFAEVTSLHQLDVATFDKIYGIEWLLRVYLLIKIYENKIVIEQNKFENIFNETIKLNKYVDQDAALIYVDRKMSEFTSSMVLKTNTLTSPEEMIKMLGMQSPYTTATELNF